MYKELQVGKVNKTLLIINTIMAFVYFSWWFNTAHIGNPILYFLLFMGEIYHILMAILFWMTIYPAKVKKQIRQRNLQSKRFMPTVDVFITVAGEPINVVRETAVAARDMFYSTDGVKRHAVYILNDSFVAGKENWQAYETLARELGIHCITRTKVGGAKAGNINHALTKTNGEIIVIFDADMVPHNDFLIKMIPHLRQGKIGFVQSPQYYKNYNHNVITQGAWKQQEFFFGPIMQGKDKFNAAFICGTNVAIRREALLAVGGMDEKNIAEDFLTSLKMHQKGWKSHYTTEVLAEGLAPEDLLSYYKQQMRWARGSLEVLFGSNPILRKGLSFSQKLQYLSSALYYFNGIVVLIDIIMPLIFLYTGIEPVSTTTTSFAIFFVPFMLLNLYTLYQISNGSMTFRAISFSQASFILQLLALKAVLLRQKTGFAVTSKQALSGNFIALAYPHILYIILVIGGVFVGIERSGITPAIVTNIAWTFLNILFFLPFISAAIKWNSIGNTVRITPEKATI